MLKVNRLVFAVSNVTPRSVAVPQTNLSVNCGIEQRSHFN